MTFIVAVYGQMNASRCLHNALLKGVFRCPMVFFDSTPIGRIINRFAKDIDVIDHEMSVHVLDFLEQVFESLGILFAVSFASPTVLAAVPFLLILYFLIQVHKRNIRHHWSPVACALPVACASFACTWFYCVVRSIIVMILILFCFISINIT